MIQISDLIYELDDFRLDKINQIISTGEYLTLLGPAGSGKTILLECLCGIRQPSEGNVYLDSENITTLPPRKRNVGYVPQDFVLFDHLNVRNNIGFSLKFQGLAKDERNRQVESIAEMLGITYLLDRRTTSLSSGEKQLTAIARALIMRPALLLLDEPVCDIDETRRMEVCALLRLITSNFGMTVVHATNDIEAAFSVATKAVILNEGKIIQSGKPGDLSRNPETEFAAWFMRCENIFVCTADEPSVKDVTKAVTGDIPLTINSSFEGSIKAMIRPENIEVFSPEAAIDRENMFVAALAGWRDFGNFVRMEITAPLNLVAHVDYERFDRLNIALSKKVVIRLRPENIHVLSDEIVEIEEESSITEDETETDTEDEKITKENTAKEKPDKNKGKK